MKIFISEQIIKRYPETQIGYVIAAAKVLKTSSYTEQLKSTLNTELKAMGITCENYSEHPSIAGWRKIFRDFGADEKQCSSVEALIKRIVTGSKMWNISNVVDLYNCCSILSLLPMGGYDLDKINGNICMRYGKKGETIHILGAANDSSVDEKHVVYADNDKVICWLWNYRDAQATCITSNTTKIIFFFDSAFTLSEGYMQRAIKSFIDKLSNIGGIALASGILDAKVCEVDVDLNKLFRGERQKR